MKKIGGCRMDKVNVTAPFATLEVSPEALTLTVDKAFADLMPCGVLTFAPEDVFRLVWWGARRALTRQLAYGELTIGSSNIVRLQQTASGATRRLCNFRMCR